MTFRTYLLAFVLPALILFLAAFWCGAQSNFLFALTGFLACFVIAAALLIEGWKKFKKEKTVSGEKHAD